MLDWMETLESIGIPFQKELDMASYLSNPSDQLRWRGFGLPSDEIAIQNAILLERFHRFPMVVDPSGQAVQFILQKYRDQKIVQSSFLDPAFFKTLASAIRFGTPLLVNDVENIDPILNPVLNKELQKTGGRTLVSLGNEDIDFSPKFVIILTTRNPTARFAPDLCSRVTMVNFTVTPASLESQTLSAILKVERPDVDHRRTQVLRLQGEQNVKLRELEEALLNKISSAQGAILDDDSVVNALEKIKAEAAELNSEVMKTQEVMDEVKLVSSIYEPLASAMATVYFSLERLTDIHYLYQFSLQFFHEILERVLQSSAAAASSSSAIESINLNSMLSSNLVHNVQESNNRVRILTSSFFNEVSRRVLRRLRNDDRIMFLVRLAQIHSQGDNQKELTSAESDFLYSGASALNSIVDQNSSIHSKLQKYRDAITGFTIEDNSAKFLMQLCQLSSFSGLMNSMASNKNWQNILICDEPENMIPTDWLNAGDTKKERISLLKILIVRALRPERTLYALSNYISDIFDFDWHEHYKFDLRSVIEMDSKASKPIMICSEMGQDASGRVDALASALQKSLLPISMGSAEGFIEADRALAQALKTGSWVLLKNVHLCTDWLALLEKRIQSFAPHSGFRLFLTCEVNPRLPSTLLRASEVLVAEASTGLKANIQRFYNNISTTRLDKQPAERVRLYGLLTWFQAVIQERLRYVPLGWTKKYEFGESDASCALDVIDHWVDAMAGADGKMKAHVDPADLPWQALRTLISQSLYGGRVDDPFDQV
jgi:dynein heavy chain 1